MVKIQNQLQVGQLFPSACWAPPLSVPSRVLHALYAPIRARWINIDFLFGSLYFYYIYVYPLTNSNFPPPCTMPYRPIRALHAPTRPLRASTRLHAFLFGSLYIIYTPWQKNFKFPLQSSKSLYILNFLTTLESALYLAFHVKKIFFQPPWLIEVVVLYCAHNQESKLTNFKVK